MEAEAAYQAADHPLFAARVYPSAIGADLDLAVDACGLVWLWDDSLDRPGPRQARPEQVSDTLGAYLDIVSGRPPRVPGRRRLPRARPPRRAR